MEYCGKCKSLIMNSSCTNKKCGDYNALCTYAQAEYILDLCKELGQDPEEYCVNSLTFKGAQELIDELLERKELGSEVG